MPGVVLRVGKDGFLVRVTEQSRDADAGVDVAIEASDMALPRDDLRAVPQALRLSRRTLRTIRQNLGWAFACNLAALPLAAFGLLNPIVGGAAMGLSRVSVVAHSVRLRRFR